jgi:hypothetical protein
MMSREVKLPVELLGEFYEEVILPTVPVDTTLEKYKSVVAETAIDSHLHKLNQRSQMPVEKE